MNLKQLRELISQKEDLKLEFKSEYKLNSTPPANSDKQTWNLFVQGQWHEFIKDILALTHGNVGTAQKPGYLIIGVADEPLSDGTRELYDTSYLQLTQQQILKKVNAACNPPISNLYCEHIEIDNKKLFVITIPPSPYVHETIIQLNTTKGKFDDAGTLKHYETNTIYSPRSVFIRRGEYIDYATDQERQALRYERDRLIAENVILSPRLYKIIQSYIAGSFTDDLYAELDQAGETDPDRKTLLQGVFVDLVVQSHQHHQRNTHKFIGQRKNRRFLYGEGGSAIQFLSSDNCQKAVIIGGPGQGKSTLGQYLSQAHRAKFLNKPWEFVPDILRIPFRVVLKNFAQWLATKPDLNSLDAYLAHLVGKKAGGVTISAEEIQIILNCHPCLLIFDGLDEVSSPQVREDMLMQIRSFLLRVKQLEYDLIILASSRPTGYSDEFDSEEFLHLELLPLEPEDAYIFASKWVQAKNIQEDESEEIFTIFKECQEDENIANLLKTPLQVNIILLIIKSGGRPPSQREALFDQYWGTILRREKSKTKGVTQIIESDETLLLNLHAYLGYLLHYRATNENIQSLLPEEEFKEAIYDFLRQDDRFSSEEVIQQKIRLLLREARDRLVLIVEPQQGLFGFELRSIQEFFAAVHLVQTAKNTDERFKRLREITCLEHWQNVSLFFAGRVARSYEGEASLLLEDACRPIDRESIYRYLKPGAWLALRIAADGALGKKRNLQYSAIEYGLKLLEICQTFEQEEEIRSIVAQLPQRDQRDMLRPILEEKIRQLPKPLLIFALDIYGKYFKANSLFKEKIDTILLSADKYTISLALNLAISYKPDAVWMAERLRKNWEWWTKELVNLWIQSPEYIEKILTFFSLSENEITNLALTWGEQYTHLRSYSPQYYSRTLELEEDQLLILEKNSPLEQLIAMFKCICLLGYIDKSRQKYQDERFDIGNIHLSLSTNFKSQVMFIDNSIRIIPDLNKILERNDLLPWLRVQIWRLYWQLNEPNLVNLALFYQDIQKISQQGILSEKFWHYAFRDSWGMLYLLVQQKMDVMKKLLPYLEIDKQLFVASQIKQTIEKYSESSDPILLERFTIAIRTGLDIDTFFPDLAILAKQMEISTKKLVNAYCQIRSVSSEKNEITTQTVDVLLTAIASSITDVHQVNSIVLFLTTSNWAFTPHTLIQAKQVLEQLLAYWKTSREDLLIQPSLMLSVRILLDDDRALDIISDIFSALAQTQNNHLYPALIRNTLDGIFF